MHNFHSSQILLKYRRAELDSENNIEGIKSFMPHGITRWKIKMTKKDYCSVILQMAMYYTIHTIFSGIYWGEEKEANKVHSKHEF